MKGWCLIKDGTRQYIRDRPTKWVMKLWVPAESLSVCTYRSNVYLGKRVDSGQFGLAYDVCMNLITMVKYQGYLGV